MFYNPFICSKFSKHMSLIKVVTFGGGGGQSQILEGLKEIEGLDITAVCTSSDSGGSTGILRQEYGSQGVKGYLGDLSKCLWSLSDKGDLPKGLMFRFEKGFLKGHSVRNIVYSALIIEHGEEKALRIMHKLFGLSQNYRVFPATNSLANLKVKLKSGQTISGEKYIDTISRNNLWHPEHNKIEDVWLDPKAKSIPELSKIIKEADFIIICPGDLFTSVIPSILPEGIPKAIEQSKAEIILISNLMTKLGETDNYSVLDFVSQIKKRIKRNPRYILCNTGKIPNAILERYKTREFKVSPIMPGKEEIENSSIKFITGNFFITSSENYIRHDSKKISKALQSVLINKNQNPYNL